MVTNLAHFSVVTQAMPTAKATADLRWGCQLRDASMKRSVKRDIRNLRRIAWYHQFLQGRDFALDGSRLFALHDTNDI